MRRYRLGMILLLFVSTLWGCASPWERSFVPSPFLEGRKFPKVEHVQIRTVEFERLQRYAAAEKKLRVESATAPQDLSPDEQLQAKNRLLETLQLPDRGEEVEILGWSEFVDVERMDANDPRLEEFARKIGANVVVVAAEYAGRVQRTIDRPMTTFSHGYTTAAGRRGGRSISYSDTSTTWVPVNVIEDQYFYTAAFLRRR
jgi:hypothetical protein